MYLNSTLSILGLYNYDKTIFDNLNVPEGIDKKVLIDNILMECAELEIIYPNNETMKFAMEQWSKAHMHEWNKMYKALHEEYENLWNTDRNESWTETRKANENSTGNDQMNSTGMQIDSVTGYNSDEFANANKTETQADSDASSTRTNVTDETITHTHRAYGNIGVTTAQQMLTQEMELRMRFNMYSIIISDFKKRFCLLVY